MRIVQGVIEFFDGLARQPEVALHGRKVSFGDYAAEFLHDFRPVGVFTGLDVTEMWHVVAYVLIASVADGA